MAVCLFWDLFFCLMSTAIEIEKTQLSAPSLAYDKNLSGLFYLNISFKFCRLMIMQTMPQKARPYGGCLNATLTTRGLRTQGQFVIPATMHHIEMAVLYMEAF